MQRLADDPQAIAHDLRAILGEAFLQIPVNLSAIFIPRVVQIDFVTNSVVENKPASPRGMRLNYTVVEAPVQSVPPYPMQGIEREIFPQPDNC
jgi:hypothetical protein